MSQFKVYAGPHGENEAVKQGWSWPGFFFTFVWAFANKMWAAGFSVIFGVIAAGFAGFIAGGGVALAVMALLNFGTPVLMFFFGREGNKWLEAGLVSKGFALKGAVEAADGRQAIELVILKNPIVPGRTGD